MDKKPSYSASLYKHSDLTEKILGAFYAVYSALGYGFLEKVYIKALIIELTNRGMVVRDELPIQVYYAGQLVEEYFADLVVNDLVILEIKATKALATEHEAQLLNYLKATPMRLVYCSTSDPSLRPNAAHSTTLGRSGTLLKTKD